MNTGLNHRAGYATEYEQHNNPDQVYFRNGLHPDGS